MPSPGVQCGTSVLECQSSLLIVRPGSGISEQECLEISQCGAGEAPAGVPQVFLRHGQMGGVQRQWELRLYLSPLAGECRLWRVSSSTSGIFRNSVGIPGWLVELGMESVTSRGHSQ